MCTFGQAVSVIMEVTRILLGWDANCGPPDINFGKCIFSLFKSFQTPQTLSLAYVRKQMDMCFSALMSTNNIFFL